MEQRHIYLIRHGAIENKGGKRFIGQIDLPLSEEGFLQAQRLRDELSCVRLGAILCSDLLRSRQTAQIIAEKHPLQPVECPELREISLGSWEGKAFGEIRSRFPAEFVQRGRDMANFCPPGGESFLQCQARVVGKFTEILQTTTGNILVVGHAGINRLILSHLLGMPIENIFFLGQDYGCLNILRYCNGKYRVQLLNKVYRIIPT